MITAQPGSTFAAFAQNFDTGLVGTITVAILGPGDEVQMDATTTGIFEVPAGSGNYGHDGLVAPEIKGTYLIYWQDPDSGIDALEELVVGQSIAAPGAAVVSLIDFRPSKRMDGVPWTRVRIDESDEPVGVIDGAFKDWSEPEWFEVETIDLDPVDDDPAKPQLRSFTTTIGGRDWYRLVFLDDDGKEDEPSAFVAAKDPQFRPTIRAVSAILRARTYQEGAEALSGEQAGIFNEFTNPTATQVENELIPQACVDVARMAGAVPGELIEDARRVAAIRTASEIERSYIPEQTDGAGTIHQTLRLTFEEQLKVLAKNVEAFLHVKLGLK
jgi:hypothetical protein